MGSFIYFFHALLKYWIGTLCWQVLKVKWLGLRLEGKKCDGDIPILQAMWEIISALLQPLHLNKQWRNLYWKERKTRKNIHWINVLTCAMESLFAVESLVALGALASLYWTKWCELMPINDLLFLLFGILLFILFLFVLFLKKKIYV